MTLIRVAHSPDSDDAFMFYALAHELIDTGGFRFEHVLSDIETLNQEAFKGTYEVTAVSIHAYAHLDDNVVRRDLGEETIAEVSRLLRQSIEYSLAHREKALDYALDYGRGLDRNRADRFVGMYVNELTVDYGDRGRKAMRVFLERAFEQGLIPNVPQLDFC